ncbi:MAG: hypothetical protein IKP79_02065 [Bacilli bacterium]|nr:hypothetical protein [Bacilli bacterium]
MNRIKLGDISNYINDSFKLGEGKEVSVYKYEDDKVLKIFHDERKSALSRLSEEGIVKLTELDLKVFNKPIDTVVDGLDIRGYTEKYLEEKEINPELINYTNLKNDIITLSENGFKIDDIFYNYIFTEDGFYFSDLTSFNYTKTDNSFLKKMFYRKNMELINIFLIGLLEYDAYRKGSSNEYTKTLLANQFRLENHIDDIYGEYIGQELKKCF